MSVCITERVPGELWRKIIRDATYLPEALDTSFSDVLSPGQTSAALNSREVFRMMRSSLATKRSISLVCAMWYRIGLEFLYEFIIVRHTYHLQLLVDLLSRYGPKSSVKRLDFVYPVPLPYGNSDAAVRPAVRAVELTAELIRLSEDLRILCYRPIAERTRTEPQAAAIQYLIEDVEEASRTLESIQFQEMDTTAFLDHFHKSDVRAMFIPNRVPTGSPLGSYGDNAQAIDYNSNFPSLHTFTLHFEISPWEPPQRLSDEFPALRHVIIGNVDPELVARFISRHPQVHTLTFILNPWASLLDRQPAGRFSFNNIHTVIFPIEELDGWYIDLPSVKYMGLRETRRYYRNPGPCDDAFTRLVGPDGKRQFPSLQLVRFMDAPLADILKRSITPLKSWDDSCRCRGIRLEDDKGQLMVTQPSSDVHA